MSFESIQKELHHAKRELLNLNSRYSSLLTKLSIILSFLVATLGLIMSIDSKLIINNEDETKRIANERLLNIAISIAGIVLAASSFIRLIMVERKRLVVMMRLFGDNVANKSKK